MATRNPGSTHQLRLVVEIPVFTCIYKGFVHPNGGDRRISEPSTERGSKESLLSEVGSWTYPYAPNGDWNTCLHLKAAINGKSGMSPWSIWDIDTENLHNLKGTFVSKTEPSVFGAHDLSMVVSENVKSKTIHNGIFWTWFQNPHLQSEIHHSNDSLFPAHLQGKIREKKWRYCWWIKSCTTWHIYIYIYRTLQTFKPPRDWLAVNNWDLGIDGYIPKPDFWDWPMKSKLSKKSRGIPLKTNISPENWWLEDDSFPFKMVPF